MVEAGNSLESTILTGTPDEFEAGYDAVRKNGAGLIDLSARGRFLIAGTEAIAFLNGLITNDMKSLAAGRWMPATFPTVQGRLIASVRVIRLPESCAADGGPVFLIDTEEGTRQSVFKTIERFTLAGDFRVTDLTDQTSQLSVQGPKASQIADAVIGGTAELPDQGAGREMFDNVNVTVVRGTHTGADGFDLIVEAEVLPTLKENLLSVGATLIDAETLEVLRIEAGIPKYGVDMDETNIITETSLDDSVSYTKGCYVGQEIIARIKYRGHVAKKLTGLAFSERVKGTAGAAIKSSDEKEIGRVTSATFSPHLGFTIALGYLKYDYLAAGTKVRIASGGSEAEATVTNLPFIGSEV